MMKTLILKTGKEIGCVTDDYIPLKNEILLSEMRLFSMNEPYWDFDKKEFYDKQPQNKEPILLDEISASRFFENVFIKTGLDEDAIIAKILAIPTQFLTDNEKVIVVIKLRKSTSFVRNDATLQQMAGILEINIDTIFTV